VWRGNRKVDSCFSGENCKKVRDKLEDLRVDGRRILKSSTHTYIHPYIHIKLNTDML